jgi:hypothetical protein
MKRLDSLYCTNACRQRAYRARKATMQALKALGKKRDP